MSTNAMSIRPAAGRIKADSVAFEPVSLCGKSDARTTAVIFDGHAIPWISETEGRIAGSGGGDGTL
jgi:hypothetical protein